MIVSAAIIDDILSLILLAVLTGVMKGDGFPAAGELVILSGNIVLFFVVAYGIGRIVVPRVGLFVRSLKTAEFEFSSLLVAALAFGVVAEFLGLHFILGAFTAGLLFERRIAGSDVYEEVKKRISAVTLGFLAPVFFASIGMHLDISAVTQIPLFLFLLIVIAFVTKLFGAGIPAYLLGLSKREACAVGVGMSARGAVELIVADIALHAGLFNQPNPPGVIVANLFSAIVIVAVVTTVATPFLLKRVFAGKTTVNEM
jgi:Kef-type K+ transport system membrane component KefB